MTTPDQHPDDEHLSAHIDEPTEVTAAHAAGCAPCRSRLARLRGAAAAVAAPVPHLGTAESERMIRAALNASREASAVPDAEPAGPTTSPAGAWPAGARRAGARRGSFLRRSWLPATGAAAALVVIVVASLIGATRHRQGPDTALKGSSSPPVTGAAGDSSTGGAPDGRSLAAAPAPSAAPPMGPSSDLGELDGAGALRSRVEPVLRAAVGGGQEAQVSGGGRSGPCETEARHDGAGSARLVLVGVAGWRGVPAVVLGFDGPAQAGGAPGLLVSVRAQADCRPLFSEDYAP